MSIRIWHLYTFHFQLYQAVIYNIILEKEIKLDGGVINFLQFLFDFQYIKHRSFTYGITSTAHSSVAVLS